MLICDKEQIGLLSSIQASLDDTVRKSFDKRDFTFGGKFGNLCGIDLDTLAKSGCIHPAPSGLTDKSPFTGSVFLRLSSKYPLVVLFNYGSHCPGNSVDQHVAVNPVNAR